MRATDSTNVFSKSIFILTSYFIWGLPRSLFTLGFPTKIMYPTCVCVGGRGGSAFVIATRFSLDDPGIESRWGEIFRTRSEWPWGPPSLLYIGYQVFPGVKAVGAWRWPPTPIYRRSWRKSRAIHLLCLWIFVACSRVNFTRPVCSLVKLFCLSIETGSVSHLSSASDGNQAWIKAVL
jgi:hypothetical protein